MFQILMLVTLLITTITVPISSAPPERKTISIAEARSLPLGTIVTIDGSITVPSGAFSSSTLISALRFRIAPVESTSAFLTTSALS